MTNMAGFGKYSNAIVIAKKGFDDFLYSYRNWHLNHTAYRSKAWLPVIWPSELNDDQTAIKALFNSFKITFSQGTPGTAGLIMTLKEGTFTCADTEIGIDHWTIPLAGGVSFTLADSLSGDPYPYYKSAYEKLQKTYNRIRQFSLDLSTLTVSGAIDYNGCKLTEDQQNVFSDKVEQLLTQTIHRQAQFVLAYLGESPIAKVVHCNELQYFYPYYYSLEVYGEGNTSEIRFPYMFLASDSTWYGNTNQQLVPDKVEGAIIMGRDKFFAYLTSFFVSGIFIGHYKSESSEGKLSKISISDDHGTYEFTLESNTEGEPVLKLCCDLSISQSFQMPELGNPSKTYKVTITCKSKKIYNLTFTLDYNSEFVTINSFDTTPGRIDKLQWIEQGETTDLLSKEYKPMYDSVVSGTTSEQAALNIASLCIQSRFPNCATLQQYYENSFKQGHLAYTAVMNFLEMKEQQMKFPTSPDTQFFEFPQDEIFSYQKLRFDDQWNLLINIMFKPKP